MYTQEHTCMHIARMYMHTHVNAHTHSRTRVYMHTHAHTHTHTHTIPVYYSTPAHPVQLELLHIVNQVQGPRQMLA